MSIQFGLISDCMNLFTESSESMLHVKLRGKVEMTWFGNRQWHHHSMIYSRVVLFS